MALIETYRPGPEGEDTFVDSTDPAARNGDLDYLEVGHVGSAEARAFMKFDVPRKPGWDVVNAILRLQAIDFVAGVDPTTSIIQAHRVGAPWEEGTATWNDQPAVSGAALASVSVGGTGVQTFGVANAVDAWQAGQSNRGLRLAYAPGDGNWVTFASSDAADPDARPYLEITWAAQAPNAPVVQVGGFPANESATVSWRFSHDDPTAEQTAYQVEILDASDGTVMLSQAKTTSSTQSLNIPSGTLVNGEEYQIRVKTWGPEDVEGPWSAFDLFSTTARPTVSINSPTSGQTVTTSSHNVTWTSVDQAQYRLRVYRQADNVLVFDSGIITSALTSHTVTDLVDGTAYRAEVEVWNAEGVGSAVAATQTFSVDTVPPATPQVEGFSDVEAGVVRLEITNPAPSVAEVALDHNEVWRRATGGEWTRVASSVPANSTFQDPSAQAGVEYEYRVTAVSTVATTASAVLTVTLDLFGVWLHEPGDPLGTLVHLLYDGLDRDETWAPEVEIMRFAGREGAVAEFGPQPSIDQVDANVQLASGTEDRAIIRSLARKRVIVCYRDGQHRKLYGVITNLTVRDEKYGGTASFRVEAVDHVETGV